MQHTKTSRVMVTEERVSTYNRPMSGENQKRTIRIIYLLLLLGILFTACLAFLVYKDIIRFHSKSVTPESLKTFASKLEYTIRYQALLVGWLLFAIYATVYARDRYKALNPLESETEKYILSNKNILQNSLESIVVAVLAQFAAISYAEPSTVLKFIPFVNVILLIGRIAFFLGYPTKRALGIALTFIINTGLVGYNLIRLGSIYGLYQ